MFNLRSKIYDNVCHCYVDHMWKNTAGVADIGGKVATGVPLAPFKSWEGVTTGVVGTGGKFAAGVYDTGGVP
jgi:hypothetical protein